VRQGTLRANNSKTRVCSRDLHSPAFQLDVGTFCGIVLLLGGFSDQEQSDKISRIDSVIFHIDTVIFHINTVILKSYFVSILSSSISIL